MSLRLRSTGCVLGIALAICYGWILVGASQAAAHADLETTTPACDAALQEPPSAIVLTFSEAPDPGHSLIEVVDASGTPVDGLSAVEVAPDDPNTLRAMLTSALPRGTYSVNWRVVATDDGHVSTGAYAFGVGQAPAPGAVVTTEVLHTSRRISLAAAAGRWLLYVGLALLTGAAAICGLVLRGRDPAHGMALIRWAMVVAVVGFAFSTEAERAAIGVPRLLPLFETHEGALLLAQGVALVLCAGAVVLVDLVPARWALLTLGATAALAMLAHVYAGHAHSPEDGRALHVATQWIHMAAVSVWIGGLPWLLMALRQSAREERSRTFAAFSRLATITLVVVLVTGALRAFAEVGSWDGLLDSTYGRALLVKLALVAGLVGLGALQHFRSVPRVTADADGDVRADATRPLRLTARGELALAAVVLATTAVLCGLAPPGT